MISQERRPGGGTHTGKGQGASQSLLAASHSCLKRTVLILTTDEPKHRRRSTLKGQKDANIYRGPAVGGAPQGGAARPTVQRRGRPEAWRRKACGEGEGGACAEPGREKLTERAGSRREGGPRRGGHSLKQAQQMQGGASCAQGGEREAGPRADQSRGQVFETQRWGCCMNRVLSRKNRELTAVPGAERGLQTAGEASLFSDSAPLRHLNRSSAPLSGRTRPRSPLSALLLSRNLLFFKVFLPRCDVLQAPRPISLLPCQTDETIHLPAPSLPPHPAHAPQLTPGSG